jgi:penicillin-binding protein 2
VQAFGAQGWRRRRRRSAHGEVLAMVSMPMFDPNLFVNGISHKDYAR